MSVPGAASSQTAPVIANSASDLVWGRPISNPPNLLTPVDPKAEGKAALDAASKLLGMSPLSIIFSGKTLDQLAQKKGISTDTLHRFMGSAVQELALKSGEYVSPQDALAVAAAAATDLRFPMNKVIDARMTPIQQWQPPFPSPWHPPHPIPWQPAPSPWRALDSSQVTQPAGSVRASDLALVNGVKVPTPG